jgi:hypothetical protein
MKSSFICVTLLMLMPNYGSGRAKWQDSPHATCAWDGTKIKIFAKINLTFLGTLAKNAKEIKIFA